MAFKALFVAHAPDGDGQRDRCVVQTPEYYRLYVVVDGQSQAVEVCRRYVADEGVRAIILCPGFTHQDVAEISAAVGGDVGVFVARGDGPSNRIALEAMTRAGWFSARR